MSKDLIKKDANGNLDLKGTIDLVKSLKKGEEITEKYGEYAEFDKKLGTVMRLIVTGFSEMVRDNKTTPGVKFIDVDDPFDDNGNAKEQFSATTMLYKTCKKRYDESKSLPFPIEVIPTDWSKTPNGKMLNFKISELVA